MPRAVPASAERRRRRPLTLPAALTTAAIVATGLLVATPAHAAGSKTIRGYGNSTTITVPNGVTEMDIVLQGGNGGSGARRGYDPIPGGAGTTVTLAHVPVRPGQQVRLVGANNGGSPGDGGAGYVRGGNGGRPQHNDAGNGGGGGGASAVLVDGVLIAVAGGGGGGGGGTFNTYGGGHPGGPGGSDAPGTTPSDPVGAGTGGLMGARDLDHPSAGGHGETPPGNELRGGGGGGGGGAAGGAGGAAGNPGGGGGGAAGASAAVTSFAGLPLTPVITAGTTSPGSVSVTWRDAPTLTIDTPNAQYYAGAPATLTTDISFPAGYRTGASYTVELEGHGRLELISALARTPWTFSDLRVGTWTLRVRAVPFDPAMGAATAETRIVVVGGSTSSVTLSAPASQMAPGAVQNLTVSVSGRTAASRVFSLLGGSVQLYEDGVPIGDPRDVRVWQFTIRWTPTSEGEHVLTAVYTPGNPGVSGSTSTPVTVLVGRPAATVTLGAPATARADATVTLTAGSVPALPGDYRFVLVDGSGATTTATVASPTGDPVTYPTPALAEGVASVEVTFTPTEPSTHRGAIESTTIDVARGQTTTTVVLPAAGKAGVVLDAVARVRVVDPDDDRIPSGTVTFELPDGTPLGSAQSAPVRTGPGWAEYATDHIPASPGTVEVVARFADTAAFRGSHSAPATSALTAWTTSATGSLASAAVPADRSAVLRVSVRADEAGAPAVAGEVRLVIDGAPVGDPIPVVAGAAALTIPAGLAVGTHAVAAVYTDASGVFTDASTAAVTLTVTPVAQSPGAQTPGAQTPGARPSRGGTGAVSVGAGAEGSEAADPEVDGGSAADEETAGETPAAEAGTPAGETDDAEAGSGPDVAGSGAGGDPAATPVLLVWVLVGAVILAAAGGAVLLWRRRVLARR